MTTANISARVTMAEILKGFVFIKFYFSLQKTFSSVILPEKDKRDSGQIQNLFVTKEFQTIYRRSPLWKI